MVFGVQQKEKKNTTDLLLDLVLAKLLSVSNYVNAVMYKPEKIASP